MRSFLVILFAYLLGSVPVGVILARAKGADPRRVGSGNIGATNVMRAAGKTTGILTLVGDVLKGFLPVLIASALDVPIIVIAAVGLAAFLGHLFPVFLKFKGGKGVATALGVYLFLNPFAVLVAAIFFVLVLLKWRFVSLGSLVGVAVVPLALYLLKAPGYYICLALVVGILIFIKHKDNIRRLVEGTENKIGKSKNS